MAAGSNPVATFPKDPDATLDYVIDWSRFLGDDRITSSTWTLPAGITKISDTFSASLAIIWLAGGSAGVSYSCVNHIQTANGRSDDRTIKINVAEK